MPRRSRTRFFPDSSTLTAQFHHLLAHGLAVNTHRSYGSAVRTYEAFARNYNLLNWDGSPFPASEEALLLFIAYLSTSVQFGTIKSYLSAVRSFHIDAGFHISQFSSHRLKRVRAGARRLSVHSERLRLPVTASILFDIFRTLNLRDYNDSLYWSACCLAFFGFLRCAEFTLPAASSFDPTRHLAVADIKVDSSFSPSGLSLFLKSSKTDQFRLGVTVYIGRVDSPVCAVQAVSHFLHLRGNQRGPLFLFRNGQPLSRELITCFLRSRLSLCGYKGYYAGHSFRIGAATAAAAAGVPDHLIKAMGRWKSEAYQAYIHVSPVILASIASYMVGPLAASL